MITDTLIEIELEGGVRGVQGPQGIQGIQGVQGPVGEDGPIGPQGDRGPAGATPDFEIGTVAYGLDAEASISGTPENPELNLTLPKGDKGDNGFSPIATVTKSNGTSTISITDVNGRQTTQVLDGVVEYAAGDGITIEDDVISTSDYEFVHGAPLTTYELDPSTESENLRNAMLRKCDLYGKTTQASYEASPNVLNTRFLTTSNGITAEETPEGYLHVYGTATNTAANISELIDALDYFNHEVEKGVEFHLKDTLEVINGEYDANEGVLAVKHKYKIGNTNYDMQFIRFQNNTVGNYGSKSTIPENSTENKAYLQLDTLTVGKTYDFTVKIMLQLGDWKVEPVAPWQRYSGFTGSPNPLCPETVNVVTGLQTLTSNDGNTYTIDLGNVELCKIGNYQDRIYMQNGKWYLYKEIGKTVITSDNKSIITSYGTNANHKKIDIDKTSLGWQSSNTTGIALINNYKEVTSFANVDTGCFGCNFNANVVRIWNDNFADLANAQDTLIGTEIYIVLATPTITEITDTTLNNNLNVLMGTTLSNDTTELTITGNLAAKIELDAYNGNINGKYQYALDKFNEALGE